MGEVRRNRDEFEYNMRGPPMDNINDQKVLFHLNIRDHHDSCGPIYKRARELVNNDITKGTHRSEDVMDTLRFLYDSCIIYRTDKDTWEKFRKRRVRADQFSRQLTEVLVPHKPPNVTTDKDAVDKVEHTEEFQILKSVERETGKPFHQILNDHVRDPNQLRGHLFYDADAATHPHEV